MSLQIQRIAALGFRQSGLNNRPSRVGFLRLIFLAIDKIRILFFPVLRKEMLASLQLDRLVKVFVVYLAPLNVMR